MDTSDGFNTDMTEVLAEALLDNIRQNQTEKLACFLQTFSEDAKNHLFPLTDDNKNRLDSQDPDEALGTSFPYPFLHVACQYARVDAVLLLLSYGVDPSLRTKEGTALEVASRHGKPDVVRKLIEWEPKLVEDKDTVKNLLVTACFNGHQDIADLWLTQLKMMKNGEDVCKKDFFSANDPLIAACKGEHYHLASYLLEKKVTVITRETSFRTGQKFTPLLQMWCQKNCDEKQGVERYDAKWSGRQFHHFAGSWLTKNPHFQRTLVKINLSHNALHLIPVELLWGLPCLESLDLSHNELTNLPSPETLDALTETRLTNLKVSHNILQFPVLEIFMLPLLENLDLSHNKISSLNHKRFPSKLVKLDDDIVWECSNMISLNLSSNWIMRIPRDINTAKSLKKLNVSNNRLSKLPAPWDCPLTNLNAAHNCITDVPDMHAYWSQSLVNLDLTANMLQEIPWTICQLTALNSLKLVRNQINKLPDPDSWSIYSLRELFLSDNLLEFAENTEHSPKRKSSNLTSKFNLKRESSEPTSTFYFEPPASVVFPESFSDCLVTLDLKNNLLQDVPASICNLSYLQKLDLSGNANIEKIPDTLAKLKNLYSLNLTGLNIKQPESIVPIMQEQEHRTRRILEKLSESFLRCSPYRGMKLMLVGPEKCGKTSVLSCLTKKEPDDDLGINICSWTLQDPAQPEVRPSLKKLFIPKSDKGTCGQSDICFSAWDLKGGELNSLIHQSFFTSRALYLLVWDLRDRLDGVEKLRPWLLNIQSRASENAIIIVSTHLDKGKKSQCLDTIRDEIRTKYCCRDGFPDIAKIVEVTATSPEGEGIKELRYAIYKTAMEMRIKKRWGSGAAVNIPLIGQMIPRTFTLLQEIVTSETDRCRHSSPPLPPIMKDAELTSHIKRISDNKIQTGQDIEEAVKFLSSSGTLVHFSDHLQGLTSLYFLDPVWLYDILSNIANINSSYVKEGRIHRSILQEQFKESGFGEGRFEEYQQLLQRFEIVLPISRIEYLVPSRLPKEKPGQDFSPIHEDDETVHFLERLYKLPYTPPGFWSRLVSRVYVFLKFLDEDGGHGVKGMAKRGLKRGNKLQRNTRLRQSMRVGLKLSRTNIMYWQRGVSVQHKTGQILLKPITFKGDKPGISVKISCQLGEFQPMGFMVDQIENLIKEWYPGLLGVDEFTGKPLIERLVPCPVCRNLTIRTGQSFSVTPNIESQEDCHHFSVSKLALSATLMGIEQTECPRHTHEGLKLRKIIPDLYLMDLPVRMLDKREFDFDPRLSRSLGSGGYGEVFKAQFRSKDVAVKMLIKSTFFNSQTDSGLSADNDSKKLSGGSDESDSGKQSLLPEPHEEKNTDVNAAFVMEGFSNLRGEVATMSKLRHPCIIHLIGISIQHLCFAMELAPLGDLASLLKREIEGQRDFFATNSKIYRTILDRVLTFKIAMQVARGVSYLHSKRIIYSDLKTDNVLLYSMDVEAQVNIKLTDYGIARPMDLQGSRGQAGPMGFCAPEILRGRTFTEKVDWFSYGMLVYHLMSGAWPYDSLKSAVEVRNAVNLGIKPGFQFRHFTVVSLFPNLELLMRQCWQDNPLDRPNGVDIELLMENASFTCLRNIINFDMEEITCIHPGASEMSYNCERLWLWTGAGNNRRCTKIHVKFFSEGELYPKRIDGSQVNCMVQVGLWELVGTQDNSIQLFGPPDVGPQHIIHQHDFQLDAEVVCLLYQPIKDKTIQGHLYAGLADGHLVIFNIGTASESDRNSVGGRSSTQEPCWFKIKTLTFDKKRCSHLELVDDRKELWIACGNKLCVLSTEIMLLDATITVTPRSKHTILGLAHHHDNLFCIIERSSRVFQYSMATKQVLQVLQCGSITLSKGDSMIPEDSIYEMEEEFLEPEEVAEESKSSQMSDDNEDEGITFQDYHFDDSVQQKQPSSTLPAATKCNIATSLRSQDIPRDNTGSHRAFSEGSDHRQSSLPIPHVQSIITVKDTLWIGTTNGDIIMMCADSKNTHSFMFGQVLGLFHEFDDKKGPIKQLMRAGEEHVVAWQELKLSAPTASVSDTKEGSLYHYQLLVWQAWGSEDIAKFDHIHHMLNEAGEKTTD